MKSGTDANVRFYANAKFAKFPEAFSQREKEMRRVPIREETRRIYQFPLSSSPAINN